MPADNIGMSRKERKNMRYSSQLRKNKCHRFDHQFVKKYVSMFRKLFYTHFAEIHKYSLRKLDPVFQHILFTVTLAAKLNHGCTCISKQIVHPRLWY